MRQAINGKLKSKLPVDGILRIKYARVWLGRHRSPVLGVIIILFASRKYIT